MRKLGFLTLGLLTLSLTATQAESLDPHTIVVSGYAELSVRPDYATVDIGVITSNTVTTKALQANNAKMQQVVAAIKAVGIPENAMQTSDFSIVALHPNLPSGYGEDQSVTIGYQVTNKLAVTVRDLDKVADVIDAAVVAGANASNSVRFAIKDEKAFADRALAAAVRDARHDAEVMASSENARVGKMISITNMLLMGSAAYNYAPPPPPPPPVARTPILRGQIVIRANVVVTYAVE
jgi:hypothetical protein